MDYKDRKLNSVGISGLELINFSSGKTRVGGYVQLGISGVDDGSNGPVISLEFAAPCGDDPTIQDAEDALLVAAIALISRFGEFDLDDLRRQLKEGRAKSLFPRSKD
jgi:hypothetical protein